MKKSYQSPSTTVLTVETGILCGSGGGAAKAPSGSLNSMTKFTSQW